MISIKSSAEIYKMQKAGEIVALAHKAIENAICDGITTNELDQIAEQLIRSKGAIPSFKNYNGFPKSICASVNDVIIHGIPSAERLKNGDIIGVDIGAYYDGFHGDAAVTFGVGEISEEAKRLIQVTENSFFEGMKFAVEGKRVSDISSAIQKYVEEQGFSVVREFVGHGVGSALHEEPEVPNYGIPGRGARLYAGMTLAVEPMINAGSREINVMKDGWTVKTADGSLSAHFEHSIAITKRQPLLLTVCD